MAGYTLWFYGAKTVAGHSKTPMLARTCELEDACYTICKNVYNDSVDKILYLNNCVPCVLFIYPRNYQPMHCMSSI